MKRSQEKRVMKKVPYNRSFIGGVLLYLLMVMGNSPFNLHALAGFVVGTAVVAWVLFWFNKLHEKSNRTWFLGLMAVILPVVFYGTLMGGLLGIIGIMLFGLAPVFLWTLVSYWIARRKKYRLHKLIGLFLVIIIIPIAVLRLLSGGPVEDAVKTRMCSDRGGTFSTIDNRCDVPRDRDIKNKFFGKIVPVPDDAGQSILFTKDPETHIVSGEILDSQNYGTVLPGEVEVLMDKALYFDAFMFAVPVAINYGGSGTFYYGFVFADKDTSLELVDTFFLGDRIDFQEFTSEKIDPDLFQYEISAHYLDRGIDDSFVDAPTHQKVLKKVF